MTRMPSVHLTHGVRTGCPCYIPAVYPKKSIIFTASKIPPFDLQLVGALRKEWEGRLCCIIIPEGQLFAVACQDHKFALGTSKGKIVIYNEATFQEICQFNHGQPVPRLRFAAANKYIVSSSRHKLCLWNSTTGKLIWTFATPDEALTLAFGEDSKLLHAATKANYAMKIDVNLLGVAYGTRPVSFWDLEEHEFMAQFHRSRTYPEPFIHAFIFNPNPDLNLAAVSFQDGVTYVSDPDTLSTVLAASPDGTVLAAGTSDRFIRLYDFETMKPLHQVFTYQQAIRSIVFISNSSRFFEIRGNYCNIWAPFILVRQDVLGGSGIDVSDRAITPPKLNRAPTYDEDQEIVVTTPHHENDYGFCGRENGSVAAYATKSRQIAQELVACTRQGAVHFLEWNAARGILASADQGGGIVARLVSKLSNTPPRPSSASSGSFNISSRTLGASSGSSSASFDASSPSPEPFGVSEPILDDSMAISAAVSQILISFDGKGLLISTCGDILWNIATQPSSITQHYKRPSPRQGPWTWTNHPNRHQLLLFENGFIKTYNWTTLDLLFNGDGIEIGKWLGLLVIKTVFPAKSRYICLITSTL